MKISELIRDEVVGDIHFDYISEGSLSRVILAAKNKDFAVITAYKVKNDNKDVTKKENVANNKELREILNSHGLGSHPLIGHWRECTIDAPYDKCPVDKLVDVVERSYFIFRSDNISQDDFKELIISLGKKYDQNAVIIKLDDEIKLYYMDGNMLSLGSTVTVNKIARGYSQYVKKLNVPFVFEGIERPNSLVQSWPAIQKNGFRW